LLRQRIIGIKLIGAKMVGVGIANLLPNTLNFGFKKGKIFCIVEYFIFSIYHLQWFVEVNFYEVEAFCHWKGNGWRLMREGEYRQAEDHFQLTSKNLKSTQPYNINLKYCSPSPVELLSASATFNHIYGNVWELLDTEFYPLAGFIPHPYYSDFSFPYFDNDHTMILGGVLGIYRN
jgi:hypothetical protein